MYSSAERTWNEYELIMMSPPIAMSLGVMWLSLFHLFLYLFHSKNFPSTIPEFFWAGSKIEIVSSAR